MAKEVSQKSASKIKAVIPESIYQLHIAIDYTKPLIWRRILVPSEFSLEALHSVIQMAMGWQMSHLYDFTIGEKRYAEPDDFGELPSSDVTTNLASAASTIQYVSEARTPVRQKTAEGCQGLKI